VPGLTCGPGIFRAVCRLLPSHTPILLCGHIFYSIGLVPTVMFTYIYCETDLTKCLQLSPSGGFTQSERGLPALGMPPVAPSIDILTSSWKTWSSPILQCHPHCPIGKNDVIHNTCIVDDVSIPILGACDAAGSAQEGNSTSSTIHVLWMTLVFPYWETITC
jgi:hypothetical protein